MEGLHTRLSVPTDSLGNADARTPIPDLSDQTQRKGEGEDSGFDSFSVSSSDPNVPQWSSTEIHKL